MLRGRRALGGRRGLRPARGPRAHRGARARWRAPTRGRSPTRAKRRQRDEMGTLGLGQPLSRGAARASRSSTRRRRAAFGLARRRRRRQHPLRLARARPPDRHRVPARDGDRRRRAPASRCPTASSPARRSARPVGRALSRRDARGDQLRAGQPADPHAPDARRRSRAVLPGARARAALRRVAQHLQGRDARRRRRSRASCSCIARARPARFGPGHPDLPPALAATRPAGADRRQHGHRVVHPRRHAAEHDARRSARPATARAAA